MLDLISIILSGQPFTPAGAPSKAITNGNGQGRPSSSDDATVELALEILGTFNFKGIYTLKSGPNTLSPEIGDLLSLKLGLRQYSCPILVQSRNIA